MAFKRFFGINEKKEVAPPPSLEDGIKMLDGRVENIETKIKQIDAEIIKQRNIMTKSSNVGARNQAKQRAMQAMKRKKMYEAQRDQMMQQSFNMEQASFTSQTLQDTHLQVQAIRAANTTMRSQFQEISIDDIEDIQDDLQEMLDEANEIQEIMSRSYEMPYDVDEADLEQELMGLELDIGEEEIPSYLRTAEVPSSHPDLALPTPLLLLPRPVVLRCHSRLHCRCRHWCRRHYRHRRRYRPLCGGHWRRSLCLL